MPKGIDYTAEEWQEAAGHRPLASCSDEELALLHRHWMWANQQREAFEKWQGQDGAGEDGSLMMAMRSTGFMFVWYGLLWSMFEACTVERSLDFRGAFRDDLSRLAPTLKDCRNAVMHVPKNNALLDRRIAKLVAVADSPTVIRRIHRGFGRLFIEEIQQRTAANSARTALTDTRQSSRT